MTAVSGFFRSHLLFIVIQQGYVGLKHEQLIARHFMKSRPTLRTSFEHTARCWSSRPRLFHSTTEGKVLVTPPKGKCAKSDVYLQ